MTETEKQELDELKKSGKLIPKEKYKTYLAIFYVLFMGGLFFLFLGVVLFSLGGGNPKSAIGILGLVITGLGGVMLYILWGFSDGYRTQMYLYRKLKKKYPEYFIDTGINNN